MLSARIIVTALLFVGGMTLLLNQRRTIDEFATRLGNAQQELAHVYDSYKAEQRRSSDLQSQLDNLRADTKREAEMCTYQRDRTKEELDSRSEQLKQLAEQSAADLAANEAKLKEHYEGQIAEARKEADVERDNSKSQLEVLKESTSSEIASLKSEVEALKSKLKSTQDELAEAKAAKTVPANTITTAPTDAAKPTPTKTKTAAAGDSSFIQQKTQEHDPSAAKEESKMGTEANGDKTEPESH